MSTSSTSPSHAGRAAGRTSGSSEQDVVRVVPAGDIHDIRVLTATGPIELPSSVRSRQEPRRAG